MHTAPTDVASAEPYVVTVHCDPQFAADLARYLQPEELAHIVEFALRHQQIPQGNIAIAITDDETVRALNREHRHVDAPTDILSFGSAPDAAQGDLALPPELSAELDHYLGDLVVAYPYTQRQAEQSGRAMADELRLLLVHGTLHLLGYDHATSTEQAEMWLVQDDILRSLAEALPRIGVATEVGAVDNALSRKRHADRNFFTGRWFSFRAAVNGTWHTLRTQPNAWIELAAIAVVSTAGAWLQISAVEWAILALTFGLILALEAINTAVEATIDLVSPDYHPLAKVAKDAAAGALVFAVLGSLGVAIAIFGPRLLALFA